MMGTDTGLFRIYLGILLSVSVELCNGIVHLEEVLPITATTSLPDQSFLFICISVHLETDLT